MDVTVESKSEVVAETTTDNAESNLIISEDKKQSESVIDKIENETSKPVESTPSKNENTTEKLIKTPKKDDTKPPKKDEVKSPKKDEVKSPKKDEIKSPKKDESKSPKKDDSNSPKKDETKSPNKDDSNSPKKDETKSPKRSPKKDKKDDESEGELEPGLLERPVLMEGKRQRKIVERMSYTPVVTRDHRMDILEGSGTKLRDIPRIELQFHKQKPDEMKPLHNVLFNRQGTTKEIKRNILKFSGFIFEKDSNEYKKKIERLNKLTLTQLKLICKALDIEYGKTKEDFINRIMEFLMCPAPSGKALPVKQASKKRKSSPKKPSQNEDDDKKKTEEMPSPSKKAKIETKTKSSTKIKQGEKIKVKISTKDKKTKTDKASKSKKDKISPPTDDQLRTDIKQFLETADLEKVTMKKVCETIYKKYPEHNLESRKYFIKLTVRENLK